jgi:hypothetical protein
VAPRPTEPSAQSDAQGPTSWHSDQEHLLTPKLGTTHLYFSHDSVRRRFRIRQIFPDKTLIGLANVPVARPL